MLYRRRCLFLVDHSGLGTSMESPFTANGQIDYCTRFYQEVIDCRWKRYWIVAILQYIHQHVQDLEPPIQPMYSE